MDKHGKSLMCSCVYGRELFQEDLEKTLCVVFAMTAPTYISIL